jgi:diacylglycerol kinase (ATP)
MPHFSRAVLIFNPAARRMQGRGCINLQQVISGLTADGLKVDVSPTACPQDASRLARNAVESCSDLVIACGGDGTINEVIDGLAGSRIPLLVLRGGTANVLAREIGLPRDISSCAALLRNGVIRRISLGKAGQRHFVLMAGIGVDAGIVAASSTRLKRYAGEGAFWLAGFQQLVAYHFAPFDLLVDGKAHRGTFAVISKARNYGGPFQFTPQANIFLPRFEICLFQSTFRWRYLYYLGHVALSRHTLLPDVRMLSGRMVDAVGGPEVLVQADGELIGTLPQKFTIEEEALSLIVPRTRSSDFQPA